MKQCSSNHDDRSPSVKYRQRPRTFSLFLKWRENVCVSSSSRHWCKFNVTKNPELHVVGMCTRDVVAGPSRSLSLASRLEFRLSYDEDSWIPSRLFQARLGRMMAAGPALGFPGIPQGDGRIFASFWALSFCECVAKQVILMGLHFGI